MHGRLKIKTTAEQEAEKKKERAAKQKQYSAGLDAVFSKRKENIHDKEALVITAQLLTANPDALTLWNFRREVLLGFKREIDEEEWQKLLEEELKTTEYCLIKNPKSYGAWHHRDWVFKVIPSPSYSEELELCGRYLQKDERNFHCWDHRRIIVNRCNRSLAEELSFTEDLIDKNFSNYSAWHYRSKLLPIIYPPPKDTPHPIPEEIFLKELRKVVAAVFTDPSDQSPWFFLRWLLGRKEEEQKLLQVGLLASNEGTRLVLIFASKVLSCVGLSVYLNEKEISIEGIKPYDDKCIWLLPLNLTTNKCEIRLKHVSWDNEVSFEATLDKLPFFKWISDGFLGEMKLSEKARKALMEMLDNCITLDQLDPGNKWVLLTLVNIMSMLDVSKHLEKILGYFGQLEVIDPFRVHYYKDLRSKLLLEEKLLSSLTTDLQCFSAPHLGLTRLVFSHYLCSVECIDLRGNSIRTLKPMTSFLNCVQLILDENTIRDLSPLKDLQRLKELSLKSCAITSMHVLEGLQRNKLLISLSLENNVVTSEDNFETKIKTLIPTLLEIKY